mgnify:CR=1 FL=1
MGGRARRCWPAGVAWASPVPEQEIRVCACACVWREGGRASSALQSPSPMCPFERTQALSGYYPLAKTTTYPLALQARRGRLLQLEQMSSAVLNADDRIRVTYEVEDLDATLCGAVGRRMSMAWRGFATLCSEVFALEFGSTSVFFEVGASIALVLPLTVLCTYVTVTLQYTFGWELYMFISFLLAFLLVFRLQTAYARYWEARTILAEAKTSIVSVGLLAVTQYHRHYGDPSDEVKLCVEGVHRYLCLFYFTLVNHLRNGDNGDVRQQNIEHYITEAEMELLRKRRGVHPPIKVVKWIGAQLCHMESMGYISPLQLHETNEGLEGMIEAFVGLEKIKTCKVPFTIRQFCTCLTLFFVYTSPFAIATGFAQVITNPNPNPNPNHNHNPYPNPNLNPVSNPNPSLPLTDPNPTDLHRLQQHPRPHAALGLSLGRLLPLDQRDVAHARGPLRRRPARPRLGLARQGHCLGAHGHVHRPDSDRGGRRRRDEQREQGARREAHEGHARPKKPRRSDQQCRRYGREDADGAGGRRLQREHAPEQDRRAGAHAGTVGGCAGTEGISWELEGIITHVDLTFRKASLGGRQGAAPILGLRRCRRAGAFAISCVRRTRASYAGMVLSVHTSCLHGEPRSSLLIAPNLEERACSTSQRATLRSR